MKAILIDPSDVPRLIDVEPTPGNLRALVGGDVGMLYFEGAVAYIDDEAHVKASPPPINGVASRLAAAAGIRPDVIRGPMVVFGMDDEGEDRDVPPDWVGRLIP